MKVKIELDMYEVNPDTGTYDGPARDHPDMTLTEEIHEHLCRAIHEASPAAIEWLGAYVMNIKVIQE